MENITCAGAPSYDKPETKLVQEEVWTFYPLRLVKARRKFESLQKLEGIWFWETSQDNNFDAGWKEDEQQPLEAEDFTSA